MRYKEFHLDDFLRESSNLEKLKEIYYELKKEIFTEKPIKTSSKPLVTVMVPNWKDTSYQYEIYSLGEYELAMIEIYGSRQDYSLTDEFNGKINEKDFFKKIDIFIYNSREETVSKIEDILLKYSRDSKLSKK